MKKTGFQYTMDKKTVVLSTAYLPPIHYFTKLLMYDKIYIEVNETYQKQSYRNRCVIYSSNGPLALTIPIVKVNGNNTKIKDIEIDYSTNWQKDHWRAIESAYRTSTYYDFISDILHKYYVNRYRSLIEFNLMILDDILKFLDLRILFVETNLYLSSYADDVDDYRNVIHPKKCYSDIDKSFQPVTYHQVFNQKYEFQPNLCIVDLLFNEGLDSKEILKQSTNR